MAFAANNEGLPFAFRPHEVLTTKGTEAVGIANGMLIVRRGDVGVLEAPGPIRIAGEIGPFSRLVNVPDPILVVEELRLAGIVAQLNHVYFSHGLEGSPVYGSPVYGSPVYGSPVYGSPVYGSPVYGSPVYGSPVYGSPVYGSPVYGSPVYGSPVYGSSAAAKSEAAPTRSSAVPPHKATRTAALEHHIHRPTAPDSPHVIVLDTGLAAHHFRPHALNGGCVNAASSEDTDEPDESHDGYLDPCAGHGTFIAGVISQVAPGCEITVHRVLSTFGDGDEWAVIGCLTGLLPLAEPERTIISLSFGGFVLDHPHAMAWAVRLVRQHGVVVVASAGNDGSSRPTFPAAFPDVIGVGAVGPGGPAPFTNYGPWVTAAAPGVELLSTFFAKFEGAPEIQPDGTDIDDFSGWAIWSGTSFAGPVVVGNLARMMMEGITGPMAVHRVLEHPSLMRIPNLGTIVNFM